MKKICGYKDSEGKFHESKFECNNEEIRIEMGRIKCKISSLKLSLFSDIQDRASKYSRVNLHHESLEVFDVVDFVIKSLADNKVNVLANIISSIHRFEDRVEDLAKLAAKGKMLRKDWWTGGDIYIDKID